MSVSPVTSSSSSYTDATSTAVRTPKQTLDAGDFMKLLSVQMQNQDPTQPMDNNQQMAQMAQMTSMQSLTQLAQGMTQLNGSQTLVLANSYLGRQVSLLDADGKSVTGPVTAVDASSGTLQLQVNGNYYPLTAITRVELPPAPATSTPAS
jgi:flagellar basal-body rod modification protein FlgD